MKGYLLNYKDKSSLVKLNYNLTVNKDIKIHLAASFMSEANNFTKSLGTRSPSSLFLKASSKRM